VALLIDAIDKRKRHMHISQSHAHISHSKYSQLSTLNYQLPSIKMKKLTHNIFRASTSSFQRTHNCSIERAGLFINGSTAHSRVSSGAHRWVRVSGPGQLAEPPIVGTVGSCPDPMQPLLRPCPAPASLPPRPFRRFKRWPPPLSLRRRVSHNGSSVAYQMRERPGEPPIVGTSGSRSRSHADLATRPAPVAPAFAHLNSRAYPTAPAMNAAATAYMLIWLASKVSRSCFE
jgi:hypothetical protein